MNNTLHTIQNYSDKSIGFCFLGLLILGNWINHWYFSIGFILVVGTISLIRYSHDKKWLFETDKYIRISDNRPFWIQALVVLGGIAISFLWAELIDSELYIHTKTNLAAIVGGLFISWGNHYHKFVNSIKSFDGGIQYPGRNQEIVPWREIYDFSVGEKILISSSKGEQEFKIHKDDLEHTEAMIADWKQQNGRRN